MLRRVVIIASAFFIMSCTTSHVEIHDQLSDEVDKIAFEQLEQANKFYKEGRLDEAETEYIKLSNSYPNYSFAYFRLGNIYVRTGQYEAAVIKFEKSIQLNPNDARAWNNLALTRTRQAIKVLEEATARFKDDAAKAEELMKLKYRLLDVTN
ncbi:tetratricopeptide repeat protein [Motilimonas cestriensis]|uniref:tetratricopeptide repeat protein n=1 Tax=Motilimonas cestriensis TaxID=2742685 RepID=UPI003DA6525D